jgi:hypothetical protein
VDGLRGCSFKVFAHRTQAVEAILREHGWQRRFYRLSGVWQVALFARP